jgi:hypothetical protein
MPVASRSAIALAPLGATVTSAFAAAAIAQPIANSHRALMTSGRFASALTSVPATNPACTAIVNQEAPEASRSYSRMRAGVAAVAENHAVIPRNSAAASTTSIRVAIDGRTGVPVVGC